jgi:hypothetical protein
LVLDVFRDVQNMDFVLIPPFIAGPDVIAGPFIIGNKLTTKDKVGPAVSEKNGMTTNPRHLFQFKRKRREMSDEDEMIEHEPKGKRAKYQEAAEQTRLCLNQSNVGHIIVRFEWPNSGFVGGTPSMILRHSQSLDVPLNFVLGKSFQYGLLSQEEFDILDAFFRKEEQKDKNSHAQELR